MQSFPAVDPIPLPAPIWLLKLLHIVTLALHFVAVEMLLGGLLLAVLLSLFRHSPASLVTARALARRLTVVMTFVINLAVPPLLFAQVLYGRALYTSSVLIGIYWISIIGLLTLTYWLLYRFTARLEAGKSAWWVGLSAWLLAGGIARLLSTNMTLMLRPEVWRQMYSDSAMGAYLPTGDPTLTPRWLMMLAGGLFIGGLWLVYLAGRSTFTAEEKRFLAPLGGKVAAVFGAVYLAAGLWAAAVQPEIVKTGLRTDALYKFAGFAGYGWLILVGLAILLAAVAGFANSPPAHSAYSVGPASCLPCSSRSCSLFTATVYATSPCSPRATTSGIAPWKPTGGWWACSWHSSLAASPPSAGSSPSWLAPEKSWRTRPNPREEIVMNEQTNHAANIIEEPGERNTRRAFLAAAGVAGLAYTAALAYPVYRYLASPRRWR